MTLLQVTRNFTLQSHAFILIITSFTILSFPLSGVYIMITRIFLTSIYLVYEDAMTYVCMYVIYCKIMYQKYHLTVDEFYIPFFFCFKTRLKTRGF